MTNRRPQRKLHPQLGLFMYLMVMVFVGTAAFNSQTNLLFWTLGLMLSGLIVTLAVGAAMLGGIRLQRRLPDHAAVARPLRVRYALTNQRRMLSCFALIVSEREGAAGGALREPPCAWAMHVPPGGTTEVEAAASPIRRGVIHFGRVRIETTFPFGFLRQSITHTLPGRVTVYPRLHPLRRGLLRKARRASFTGSRPSGRRGGRDEFFGIREYRASDSMKMIDWKHSARLGQLVTREMTQQSPPRMMILLDLRNADDEREHQPAERAISFAASIVSATPREGVEVGLAVSGVRNPPAFTPDSGRWHRDRLLTALAELNPGGPPDTTREATLGAARRDAFWLVLHAGPIDAAHGPADALHLSDADLDSWRTDGDDPPPARPAPEPATATKQGAA